MIDVSSVVKVINLNGAKKSIRKYLTFPFDGQTTSFKSISVLVRRLYSAAAIQENSLREGELVC